MKKIITWGAALTAMTIIIGLIWAMSARTLDDINANSGLDAHPEFSLKSQAELDAVRKRALGEDQPDLTDTEIAENAVQRMQLGGYGSEYQEYPGSFPPALAALVAPLEAATFSQSFQDQERQGIGSVLQGSSSARVAAILERDGKVPPDELEEIFGPKNPWGQAVNGVSGSAKIEGRYAWPEKISRPFLTSPIAAFLPSEQQLSAYDRICAPANPKIAEAGSGYRDLCLWMGNAVQGHRTAVRDFEAIKSSLPAPSAQDLGAYRVACLGSWIDPSSSDRDYSEFGSAAACALGTMWITGETTS